MIAIIQTVIFCFIISFTTAVINIPKTDRKPNTSRFIVTLKKESNLHGFLGRHGKRLQNRLKHVYGTVHHGFVVDLNEADFNFFNSSEEVLRITVDGIMTIATSVTQTTATWGLQRLTQNLPVPTSGPYSYKYDSIAGEGVNIYVIDTGINIDHTEFGGRASLGPCFMNGSICPTSADNNGHGTHCAGTAAGTTYGVAKKANLIAIKVLGADGSGYVSDIIAAIEYVCNNTSGSKRVISMSIGGSQSTDLDDAVNNAVTVFGIVVCVAAGNGDSLGLPQSACNLSPSGADKAITVAAIDIQDKRAQWSNCGPCVDIFAPGVNIVSAWIGNTTATNTISGTSMATPHVAGLSAYLMAKYNITSPALVLSKIIALANKDKVTGINQFLSLCWAYGNTPNLLARNDQ